MEPKKSKLVIEENTLYEIDLECMRKKERLAQNQRNRNREYPNNRKRK